MRALHKKGRPGLTLTEFVAAAWHVVEPATPLTWNWHIDAIARHVEPVILGAAGIVTPFKVPPQNLLINVPPGTMKSLILSVFAPAWTWLWWPAWRSIFTSGNHGVALRDSVRCRDLVESDWYRKTFDVRWTLADDQNAKSNFKNSAGGSRLAISVGAKVTGERAHSLFVDDPMDAADAPSKVTRDGVKFWFDQALRNRVAEPSRGSRIIIMQRLHEEDLSGHVLSQGDWGHLCLPQEFETQGPGAKKTWLGWKDPRKKEGELLFPQRFSPAVLESERRALGSAGYAGQHQQRPAPAAGNKFKRDWWRYWSSGASAVRPRGASSVPARIITPKWEWDEIIGSWDCAFKGGTENDFVVGLVVGRKGADRYILQMVRKQMGFGETKAAVRQMRADWPKCYKILIEDKANGPAIIETLAQEVTGIVPVEPMGGKEARAAALEPEVEAGNWYLPEGAEWLETWIEEFASFPLGKNDDIVDACSQAAIRFHGNRDLANTRALLGLK